MPARTRDVRSFSTKERSGRMEKMANAVATVVLGPPPAHRN